MTVRAGSRKSDQSAELSHQMREREAALVEEVAVCCTCPETHSSGADHAGLGTWHAAGAAQMAGSRLLMERKNGTRVQCLAERNLTPVVAEPTTGTSDERLSPVQSSPRSSGVLVAPNPRPCEHTAVEVQRPEAEQMGSCDSRGVTNDTAVAEVALPAAGA